MNRTHSDAEILGLAKTVNNVALRVAGSIGDGFPIADARQAAWEGAIRAVHSYDPSRGAALATYAYRCAMNSALTEARRFVGCQSRTFTTLGTADAFRDSYVAKHGCEPSDETIDAAVPGYLCAAAAMNVGEFNDAIAPPTPSPTPEDLAVNKITVDAALAPLDPRRRRVLISRAVLEQTYDEIATPLGIARERARQLFVRASAIAMAATA
jgi:RNA polymerase sigma factor (sigma-70 family)